MSETFFTGKPCRNGHLSERDVKTGLCVECTRARNARSSWASRNPEKRRAAVKKYRDANREKCIAASLRSIAKKPQVAKAWVEQNRVKVRGYKKKWVKSNPDQIRLKRHKRRALEVGRVSKDIIQKLSEAQRGKCANCRCLLGADFHLDHIVPLARNGAHADENMQLLCAACNWSKSSKDPIRWAQEQGRLL